MPWISRDRYQEENKQKDKIETKKLSEEPVDKAISLLEKTGKFNILDKYEPKENKYYRNGAPIVKLPGRKLKHGALAPDIRGELKNGSKIWVEVKDKSQRIFYPDTGCDIHQFIGFWTVNKFLEEPVLMMFKDPPLDDIELPNYLKESKKRQYLKRVRNFYVNGEPGFYGNWLSTLCDFDEDNKYPHCWKQWSRNIPMKIVYFEIRKMVSLEDVENLTKILKDFKSHKSLPQFKVYDDEESKTISDISFYRGD